MNNNEFTLAVKTALNNGGRAAETELAVIADKHGDQQLAAVIEELTAPEILAIIEESDMSKPSLASVFATAEQFLAVIERKVEGWKYEYGRMDIESLSASLVDLQNDIEAFICPMVYSADSEAREREMLVALANQENGPELAMLAGVGRKDFMELYSELPDFHPTKGTWQSLLFQMQSIAPRKFKDLKAVYKFDDNSEDYHLSVLNCAFDLVANLAISQPLKQKPQVDEFINF